MGKELEDVLRKALSHDRSEEWQDLIEKTILFARAMYEWDEAIRRYKRVEGDKKYEIDTIVDRIMGAIK